jgi:hypothetical protein
MSFFRSFQFIKNIRSSDQEREQGSILIPSFFASPQPSRILVSIRFFYSSYASPQPWFILYNIYVEKQGRVLPKKLEVNCSDQEREQASILIPSCASPQPSRILVSIRF